jgi:hypothetical protein
MKLKNLIKKLIDMMFFSDHKVYIQLYKYDKKNETFKYYNFNIVGISEGGNLGSEEYTIIEGKINSCVEVDSDYIPAIQNGEKFGKFVPKLTKRKITVHE